ncbi:MAG: DUF4258 domain-containing protein [Nitrospirae bacterium]|nr:DUF4258 domain-containing protein [Nitrospirota bacterium]
MKFEIKRRISHPRGEVIEVHTGGKTVSLLLTFHAKERIQKWRLTESNVLKALLGSEEVLKGHRDRFIAHRRQGRHVVRAVYEYENRMVVVITVYFPLSKRYFEGGGQFEDQILA